MFELELKTMDRVNTSYSIKKDNILYDFYSKDKKPFSNWKDKTTVYHEKILMHTVPDNATFYHKNYLHYLQQTYGKHYGYVIAPHTFWYSIMCEVAQHTVKYPEPHRHIFTTKPKGKTEIIVPGELDQPLHMDAIYEKLVHHIPVDTNIFLPIFSTTTEMSKLATLGAFFEMASPYYRYGMYACGYPKVRIDGIEKDWIDLNAHLIELADIYSSGDGLVKKYLINSVKPFLINIFKAMEENDEDWFGKMFTQQKCGSGSQFFVDGHWPNSMFMERPKQLEVENFSDHITRVPYFIEHMGKRHNYYMVFSLSHSNEENGLAVPDFSMAQVKVLETPEIVPQVNDPIIQVYA